MKSFTAFALEDFPLVNAGDDIAKIIVDVALKNGLSLEDGDVLVVAQKVFSKAEGRVVRLGEVVPSKEAKRLAGAIGKRAEFVELVLRETKKIVRASQEILLIEDKRGLVCINAGIDKSNVQGRDNFALLPENPDESAEKCRSKIRELTGKGVAVIICDTYSRPFRRAQVNFAIGFAGIWPFRDYRGKKDMFGQVLKVKNIAVVDELAASAELLMGQGNEARPVVICRGLADAVDGSENSKVTELYMSACKDLFKGAL
ncbi:MAG TPA: coenzyme F420-0:L-glutamate ligase [Candidatus Acidoferrum sp.]|nr:coenzyme F420-0:L-glutamate ligase [Candidatus Acidoferrum sp.]